MASKLFPSLLALASLGCSAFIGRTPFSHLPAASGKIDKTPEVSILRGQNPVICALPGHAVKFVYFIHLKWMKPQQLWVLDEKRGELPLWGTTFTIKVNSKGYQGQINYVTTKFRTEQQQFEVTTLVADCGASAGVPWSFGGTVSGSADSVAGS